MTDGVRWVVFKYFAAMIKEILESDRCFCRKSARQTHTSCLWELGAPGNDMGPWEARPLPFGWNQQVSQVSCEASSLWLMSPSGLCCSHCRPSGGALHRHTPDPCAAPSPSPPDNRLTQWESSLFRNDQVSHEWEERQRGAKMWAELCNSKVEGDD